MRIFLDYDSVLVDLHEPWCKFIYEKYGDILTTKDIKTWTYLGDKYGEEANSFFKQPKIYESDLVSPLVGSVSFVEILKSVVGRDNVYIVSRCEENLIEEKAEHANKHFNIKRDHFFSSHTKWLVTGDSILVDDNPAYVLNHINTNKYPGILYNRNFEYGWANLGEGFPACKIISVCPDYNSVVVEIIRYILLIEDKKLW